MPISSYLDVLSAHYECTGTAGLIDSIASANWTEIGTVGEVTTGKIGNARGPCSGNHPTGPGFNIAATPAGSIWDTRVSQGFTACTLSGWMRLNSATGDQEYAAQARAAAANNTKQWMLRPVFQDLGGAGNDGIVLFIWDHVANTLRVAAADRLDQGAMPTGQWIYTGFSVDLVEEVARTWLGIPSEALYFDERAINPAWNAFEATNLDVLTLGTGSGFSTGGIVGDIDHVDWYNGYAFDEGDVINHYNDTQGLLYPDGYTVALGTPSGKSKAKRSRYYDWRSSK